MDTSQIRTAPSVYTEQRGSTVIISTIIFVIFLFYSYEFDPSPTLIDNVNCGSEPENFLVLMRCSFSTFISSSCDDEDDVGVSCCESINKFLIKYRVFYILVVTILTLLYFA